jgi:hypothetical protein
MPETAKEGFNHLGIAQEAGPLIIGKVGCNNCWPVAVALLHKLEEDVGLLGLDIEIA